MMDMNQIRIECDDLIWRIAFFEYLNVLEFPE
jgi:hypothetical protein